MKLSTEEKVRNFDSLVVDSQLDMKTPAHMEDFKSTIKEDCSAAPTVDDKIQEDVPAIEESSPTFKAGDFIVGLFT